MLKTVSKRNLCIVGLVLLLILLGITAKVSYYLGERHISELVLHSSNIPDGKPDSTPPNYKETVRQLQSDLNRLSNDYDSTCYRYQELYTAYDALYTQFGPSSGHEKIVRPDSARGNEESCYR